MAGLETARSMADPGGPGLGETAHFTAMLEAAPAAMPTDPTSQRIRSSHHLTQLLELKTQAELNELKVPLDSAAFAIVVAAAEDAFDDIEEGIEDPMLSHEQNDLLYRVLPWVVVDRSSHVYMAFATEATGGRIRKAKVFSTEANKVRARAKLGCTAEATLNASALKKEVTAQIKSGRDPSHHLQLSFRDLYSRAAPQSLSAHREVPVASSLEAAMQQKFEPANAKVSVNLSSQHVLALENIAAAISNGTPPGDDAHSSSSSTSNFVSSNCEMTQSNRNEGSLMSRLSSPPAPPPPPPPPPPPHVAALASSSEVVQPTKTSYDRIGSEVLEYLSGAGPPPATGLEYVSQRLLARLDGAKSEVAREPASTTVNESTSFSALGHGYQKNNSSTSYISPLLLASPMAGAEEAKLAVEVAEAAEDTRRSGVDGVTPSGWALRPKPTRYLPSSRMRKSAPLQSMLSKAEAIASQLAIERTAESRDLADSSSMYIAGLEQHMKAAGSRVTDRVPQPRLQLNATGLLFHEFDPQVERQVLYDIDAPLSDHLDIRSTMLQIVDAVDVTLPAWHNLQLAQGGFAGPSAADIDTESGYTVADMLLGGSHKAVVSDSLQKNHIDAGNLEMLSTKGLQTRSYAARPPRVIADAGAPKEVTKQAREYAAWRKWWQSTISTTDYLEYAHEQKTDLLGAVYGLLDTGKPEDQSKATTDTPLTEDERDAARRVLTCAATRAPFEPGQWNVKAVSVTSPEGESDKRTLLSENADAQLYSRLEICWGVLKIPMTSKLKLSVKYAASVGSKAVGHSLDDLEKSAYRLRDERAARISAVDLWERVAHLVPAREKLLATLRQFEERGSDPLRYFEPAAAGARLREESQRAKIDTRLARVSADLLQALDTLDNEHGDIVLVDGFDYRKKMSTDRKTMLLELEEERHTHLVRSQKLQPLPALANQFMT